MLCCSSTICKGYFGGRGMTKPNGENKREQDQWTVRDVLVAMSGKGYPTYLLKFITDVQSWMEDILAGEELRDNEREILMPYLEEPFEVDMDNLFSRLEWAEEFAEKLDPKARLYLQPEWSKAETITPLIVEYVKNNPKWQISVQTHKYMNIP